MSWQVARARPNIAGLVAADPEVAALPAWVGCIVEDHLTDHARLMGSAGLVPSRWFDHLRRNLRTAPPRPHTVLPDGLNLVRYAPEVSERVRLAQNEVFLDHWGSQPFSVEDWAAAEAAEAFRPALSLALVDAHEEGAPVVAYAVNHEHTGDADGSEERVGYTEILGGPARVAWPGPGGRAPGGLRRRVRRCRL